ncbi:headcase protein homolog [Sycon ciliatum]|uniref:headcase protein homolog n=1 Tax=Sycon ciliatum TaxID=27933 RepID=UPI0020AC6A40|eukprot:scpid28436/ scgid18537/ Headcase protein homolog
MPFSREQKAKAKAVRYGKGDDGLDSMDSLVCCKPGGCLKDEKSIASEDKPETERVVCSWEGCTRSGVMHRVCFNDFEDQVLTYLKGAGRARSWSEKQRRQNVWNKKGYDLAYKACNCDCGKGFLRKDMDYRPSVLADGEPTSLEDDKRKKKLKKSSDKPVINPGIKSHTRTHSSSSGYSTSSSLSGSMGDVSNFSIVSGQSGVSRKSSTEGYLQRRMDMTAFKNAVPKHRMNAYNVRMDDEKDAGPDDLRQVVSTGLISHRLGKVPCCLCRKQLPVYDRYPVVDGVIYLTPLEPKPPQRLIPLRHESSVVYLLAVCLQCILGPNRTTCSSCSAPWIGEQLLLGSIYSFDIFSASPCCESRTICAQCHEPAIQLTGASMLSYSQCSGVFGCENCGYEDAHLVQPLSSYDVSTVSAAAATAAAAS